MPPDLAKKERLTISTFKEYCFIRLIPMYWGVSQSIRLVPKGEYDVIVRIRPDVVPLQRLNASLLRIDNKSVFFAYHMQQAMHAWSKPVPKHNVREPHLAGYNDLLFWGAEGPMRHFENCYDLVEDFCIEKTHSHFTPVNILDFILKCGVREKVRAPVSLYLIDEEHSKMPLASYEERRRAATRRESDTRYVGDHHPDLLEQFLVDIPPLHAREKWYNKCWVEGGAFVGSPQVTPSAKRIVMKRYNEVKAGKLISSEDAQ